jgi:hypothetical protein
MNPFVLVSDRGLSFGVAEREQCAQDVGRIELGDGSSLVEVPAGFAQGLSAGGNWFETANGQVKISPVAEAPKGRKTRR